MQDRVFDIGAAFTEAVRCYSLGHLDESLALLNALVARKPAGAPRWFAFIGNIHLKQGRPIDAAHAFVREARVSPDFAAPMFKNAAVIYHQHGRWRELSEIAAELLRTNPKDTTVAYYATIGLVRMGQLDDAAPLLDLLDYSQPQQVSAAYDYYTARRDPENAFAVLTRGLSASPEDAYLLSTRYAEARNILDIDTMRDYADLMSRQDDPRANTMLGVERALNRLYWSTSEEINARPCIETLEIKAATGLYPKLPRRTVSAAGNKIRLGYLSDDFTNHVVIAVLMDILLRHDGEKFDLNLFCYTHPKLAVAQESWPNKIGQTIISVHDWDSGRIAREISDRNIDILIDLKGHTAGARLDIVNLSDAPIKVGYLGYPSGTSGVDLDYAITDHFITPDSSKPHFREKLCRLPGSLMPNPPLTELHPVGMTREDWGLPQDRFVFGSFNAIAKLSLRTIEMWTRILAAAPEALLWIRCDVPTARKNLLREFSANGISTEQVHFAEVAPSYQDHIARLALADLALDPTPYNGHVTTTDMLRAGLPVLTLKGTTCSSRMTFGQLSVLGLPELIAESEEEYISKAVGFVRQQKTLRDIRHKLAKVRETSSLFDPDGYTRKLERAFELMVERARAGLSPDHIDVPETSAN